MIADLVWHRVCHGMSVCPQKLLFHWENDRKMMIKLSKLGSNPIFSLKTKPKWDSRRVDSGEKSLAKDYWWGIAMHSVSVSMSLAGTTMRIEMIECKFSPGAWGSSPEPDRLKHGWKQPSRKLLCTSLHVRAFFGTGLAPVVRPSFAGPPRCEMLAVAKCWRSVFSGH